MTNDHDMPTRPGSLKALSLVMLTHVSSAFCAFAVPPLAPFLQPELQISKGELGVMISSFYAGVVLASVPGGYLADRLKAKWVMATGNTAIGVFIILVALVPSYLVTLPLMMFAGTGYALMNPVTTRVVMAWFRARRRATAMSIKQMGVTLGGVLAAALLPSIASSFSWHVALQFAGAFTVACGIVIVLLYRETPVAEEVRFPEGGQRGLRSVLASRQIVLVGTTSGIFSMAQCSVTGYLVLFLHEAQLLPAVTAGLSLAVAQSTGAMARIGWGFASDVFLGGKRRLALLIIGMVIVAASAMAAVLPSGIPVWGLMALSAVFGGSALGWNGVLLTLTGESSQRDMVGLSSGVVSALTFSGIVVWSPIFGSIVDQTGSFSWGWYALVLVMLCCVVLMKVALGEAPARPKAPAPSA